MPKSRPRTSSDLSKREGADHSEYFLLVALIVLIIGVVVLHLAHVRFP